MPVPPLLGVPAMRDGLAPALSGTAKIGSVVLVPVLASDKVVGAGNVPFPWLANTVIVE